MNVMRSIKNIQKRLTIQYKNVKIYQKRKGAWILKKVIADLMKQHCIKRDLLRKELKNRRSGKLYVREINGRSYFSERIDGKIRSITKNDEEVCRVARKEYIQFLLCKEDAYCRALEEVAAEVKSIDEKYDEEEIREKLDKLQNRGIDLNGIYWSRSRYEWAREQFETNPYKPEHLRYVTKSGIRVRSKSERVVADRLTERGILFRYEMRIDTASGVMYPDFVIRKENGELVVWEHFGLMDKNDYMLDAMKKIVKYRSAGFVQHKNLICTWEEDLESLEMIDEIIDRFIISM